MEYDNNDATIEHVERLANKILKAFKYKDERVFTKIKINLYKDKDDPIPNETLKIIDVFDDDED